jgi:hypothetical protein
VYVQQAGRDIGGVVKAVDAHLESRSDYEGRNNGTSALYSCGKHSRYG